mgnify:CR=1 FL=1
MSGHIRVIPIAINQAPDAAPEDGEVVIIVDRSNEILGNHYHVLKNKHDMKDRCYGIKLFEEALEKDKQNNGIMTKEIIKLAERVKSGEQICLACHCYPLPCHADVIVENVYNYIYANDPVMIESISRYLRRRPF